MKPRLLLLALAFGAVVPTPAVAQEGSGLYEPSPRKAAGNRADRFVTEMLSAEAGERVPGLPRPELEEGRLLGDWAASAEAATAATDRAAEGGGWLPSPAWSLAVALALAGAGLAAARRGLASRGTAP